MRQRGEVGLIGRLPVKARMWSSAVVEADVLADGSPGLGHRVVGSEIYLYLNDRQSRSTKTLSRHEPLPSMLMAMLLDQHAGKLGAGELATLIGVEDVRRAVFR
jgi:hypothetical protein